MSLYKLQSAVAIQADFSYDFSVYNEKQSKGLGFFNQAK